MRKPNEGASSLADEALRLDKKAMKRGGEGRYQCFFCKEWFTEQEAHDHFSDGPAKRDHEHWWECYYPAMGLEGSGAIKTIEFATRDAWIAALAAAPAMKRGGEGDERPACTCPDDDNALHKVNCPEYLWKQRVGPEVYSKPAAPAMKRDQLDTQRQAESDGDCTLDELHKLLDAHRHEQYNLRCGCTCGWGTRLIGAEEGYQLWIAHVAERLSATAATPTEPPKPDGSDGEL